MLITCGGSYIFSLCHCLLFISVFYFNFFDYYNEWHRLMEPNKESKILVVSFESVSKLTQL